MYLVRLPPSLSCTDSACNAEDVDLITGVGRSPGGGHGNPLQYSCLENSMNREVWQATIHSDAKSWTWWKRVSTHACTHTHTHTHTHMYESESVNRSAVCDSLCPHWLLACQDPLSMGFSRKEYWSEVPCPPLGDLLDPWIELKSLMSSELEGGLFTTNAT